MPPISSVRPAGWYADGFVAFGERLHRTGHGQDRPHDGPCGQRGNGNADGKTDEQKHPQDVFQKHRRLGNIARVVSKQDSMVVDHAAAGALAVLLLGASEDRQQFSGAWRGFGYQKIIGHVPLLRGADFKHLGRQGRKGLACS